MPSERLRLLTHQLAGVRGRPSQLDDGELLGRFAEERDEAAFEVLVWRHGAMVLGVCQRLLGRGPDAEDAFQATFLTLVRKAGGIRDSAALAGWLYRVAYRAASALRLQRGRRGRRERQLLDELPAADIAGPDDLHEVLDEELARLPEKLRRVVVLCYLEGQTTEEAAAALGCPRGTVLSRLAAARERLRRRLQRRGVAPAAALASLAAWGASAQAGPPAALVGPAVRATLALAAGNLGAVPPAALALSQGVLRAMFILKIKLVVTPLLLVGVSAVAVTVWLIHATGNDGPLAHAAAGPPGDQPISTDPSEPKLPKVRIRGGEAGPESFDQAIEWLKGDQLQQLIAIGSLARAEVYPRRQGEIAAELEKLLNGRDRLVALESTKALYVWATKEQVPSLLRALDDPNTFVRQGAVEVLGPLQDERAVAPVAKFLTAFAERDVAGRSLIRMGPMSAAEVRKYLSSQDKGARETAARVLRQIGKVDKDDDFTTALGALQDPSVFGRRKALQWFAAADPEHPRRAEAARAIARLLADGSAFDKQDAAKALAVWATSREVPVLIDTLKQGQLPLGTKPVLLRALGRLKDDRAIPAVAEMLADPFDNQEAVKALVGIGPLAEDEVLRYLAHERSSARAAACKVLKEIGTKKSLKELQAAQAKANREMYGGYRDVAAAAKAAIDAITARR